jgi:transcriptional regulator GlxA family with amidase domain
VRMNTALSHPRPNPLRKKIVERAEQLLRDRPDEPLLIADLSLLVGVSERGLRNAFKAVRGMSPKRCVIHDRLNQARRALCDPHAIRATVTDIATEHGFFELGRFAGRYKAVFGETPSATLRAHGQAG